MLDYMRIRDNREPTFDSLEQICAKLSEEGWSIVMIDTGDYHRTATLVRERPEPKPRKKQ